MNLRLILSALCAASSLQATKTVLVPFDGTRPYQQAWYSRVQKVVHYEYTFGGHSQANSRNSLTRLAQKYGFALEQWTAQEDVTAANLLGVSVFVANNGDGDVFQPKGSASELAIRNFVEVQGGGFLTLHDAAAYVPCPVSGQENLADGNCRWLARVVVRQYYQHDADNTRVRLYADSVQAGQLTQASLDGLTMVPAAINHGRRNPQTRMIFEGLPRNGAGSDSALSYVWDGVGDEWEMYRGYVRQQGEQVHDGVTFGAVIALLSIDDSKYTSSYKMGDHVMSWTRTVGNGLAAHNHMGHSNVWTRTRTGGSVLGTASVNDSFPEKYNWRLMRYLARDFVGCLAPSDRDYNPEASVLTLRPEDPCPCNTASNCSVTSVQAGPLASPPGISVQQEIIRVTFSQPGIHEVQVTDVMGRAVFSAVAAGNREPLEIAGLQPGLYFVRVVDPDGAKTVDRISLF